MSVFERIVVGVDGRSGGRDAHALAALLQRVCGGEVMGQHRERRAGTDQGSAGALLRRRCRWESRAVPARSVEEGLLAGAAAERAVAIVVGSSRRRRGRRTLGERLVRRTADCAVRIAPLGYRARVDGLLDARAALR